MTLAWKTLITTVFGASAISVSGPTAQLSQRYYAASSIEGVLCQAK